MFFQLAIQQLKNDAIYTLFVHTKLHENTAPHVNYNILGKQRYWLNSYVLAKSPKQAPSFGYEF